MPKIERTYLSFILSISLLMALFLLAQNWKRQLAVEKVKVYDTRILTGDEVRSLAEVPIGAPLYALNLMKIARNVEQSPFVDRAVVVRALPYDLTITVSERDPIAIVATGSTMLSVDGNGIMLPLPMQRKNNMPVITNVQGQLGVGDTARGALMQAVKFIQDTQAYGPALTANIAEVRLDGGNLVAYTTASSLPVIIGTNDFERKLLYLQKFLTDVDNSNATPNYSYVDLRFNGQIVLGTLSGSLHNQIAMKGPGGKEN